MRHTVQAQGFGVRLRPVRMEDAAFIVWLRNQDYALGKIGDSATDVAGQQRWLEAYFTRPNDYYFIVESLSGLPLGTHSLYDLVDHSAELGRWVIRPGVQAAVPSHMVCFQIAFERLGLRALRNTTVSTNTSVLSISRRFGFENFTLARGERTIGGKPVDMMHSVLTAQKWAQTRPALVAKAQLAEQLVLAWEQAQTAAVPNATAAPQNLFAL